MFRFYSKFVLPKRSVQAFQKNYFVQQRFFSFDYESRFSAEEIKRFKRSFAKLDRDKDGALSFEEFQHIAEHKKLAFDMSSTKEIFKRFDLDGTGKISLDEYFNMIDELRALQTRPQNSVLEIFRERILASLKDHGHPEITDPNVIFNLAWTQIVKRHGEENLRFPRELIWLGGAPGAGKGSNTPYIMQSRGLTAAPIIMSDLLNEFPEIKSSGKLVSDQVVTELILEKLLEPRYRNGVIIDGYPRTEAQVHCLHLLRGKMGELRQQYGTTAIARHFPRPRFIVAILFVDEAESIRRQLFRGEHARLHNAKVKAQGFGELMPVRDTDVNEDIARNRYNVFLEHYHTIQKLKDYFTFKVINAIGSLTEVHERIHKEFAYQSGNELSQAVFETICDIPTVHEIRGNARQLMCSRLEDYVTQHKALFSNVVAYVAGHFIEQLRMTVISGEMWVQAPRTVFSSNLAIQMAVDLMSERGYWIVHRFDLSDENFVTFKVTWPTTTVRKGIDTGTT